jgi:hypothetical protein
VSFASVTLATGDACPVPLSADVMRCVASVEVNESDEAPSGFQVNLRAERSAVPTADLPLLTSGVLAPFKRVHVSVNVLGQVYLIMDGVITHLQMNPGPQGSSLTVTGEDVSYYMDLVAYSLPYPAFPDAGIAAAALAKYSFIGIVPALDPTIGSYVPDPLVEVRQQNETDRALVKRLAGRNGAIFYVEPGPSTGSNVAYWGAPPRSGVPQPTLSVNLGPVTNVRSLTFAADMSAPTFLDGIVQASFEADLEVPITTFTSTVDPLSSSPALGYSELLSRRGLFDHQGLDPMEALAQAQAMTDTSTLAAATASGELDVFRYGAVLRPRRLVTVRGAGTTFDGLWYVKSVKHVIKPAEYTQSFELVRGGLGSTVTSVS